MQVVHVPAQCFSSAAEGAQQRGAEATALPSAVKLSAADCTEPAELEFYLSLLSKSAAANERAAEQADARKALREGTYFVLGGVVCDSRGRELGNAEEVLGPEYGAPTPQPQPSWSDAVEMEGCGRPPRPTLSGSLEANARGTEDPLLQRRAGEGRPPPTAASSLCESTVGGTRRSGIKGGGQRIHHVSSRASKTLSAKEMQDNWDALC